MKRIRIIVAGILVLGILLGGISIYEFFHTEEEPLGSSEQTESVDKAKKNTREEEVESPRAKKLEKDYWYIINGRLTIYSDTQLQKKESLKIPATYEGKKVHAITISCREGTFSTFLKHAEIENGVKEIEYGFVTCPNLETAVIPKSIKKMSKWEFKDCKKKVTLYVEKNSYAEKWAKKHNIRYKYGRPKEEE